MDQELSGKTGLLLATLLLAATMTTVGRPALAAGLEQSAAAPAGPVTYTREIQPLVAKRCLGCHGPEAPEHRLYETDKEGYQARSLGPRLDSYTHLASFAAWPDTGALMRRLDDGTTGKVGNMYQHLGETEAERQANLQLFKAWVGLWSTKRWKDTSKEEINAMLLPY